MRLVIEGRAGVTCSTLPAVVGHEVDAKKDGPVGWARTHYGDAEALVKGFDTARSVSVGDNLADAGLGLRGLQLRLDEVAGVVARPE